VTAKFKRAAGFLGARKDTAATIAPMQRRRALEEIAVAVIRTAGDGHPDSLFIIHFIVIETRDNGLVSPHTGKGQTAWNWESETCSTK
jgi:hypothetical protein